MHRDDTGFPRNKSKMPAVHRQQSKTSHICPMRASAKFGASQILPTPASTLQQLLCRLVAVCAVRHRFAASASRSSYYPAPIRPKYPESVIHPNNLILPMRPIEMEWVGVGRLCFVWNLRAGDCSRGKGTTSMANSNWRW